MAREASERTENKTNWRVLLVEDDVPVRNRLARILEGWDQGSLIAACGTLFDAKQVIERETVDLLITDLRLPDGTGIEAIRRLKDISPDAEAMVISVLADQRTVLDAIEAGAAGYLHKDAYAIDLLEAVKDLLAGRSPISSSIARLLVRRLAGHETHDGTPDAPSDLTVREMEILNHIARGLTYEEIAARLEISRNTVPVHIRNIYRKLSVNNRSQAVFEARERGILPR
ncbi:response regulator transcription factor [Devosia sp.]|uniref:response regulator n=1 Tax=Devosia sp. TaxID=1871048 RepID=UPI0019E4C13C|nr:response regulator transcription factor [Devosia sp.]MBE0580112.1 response regulator transcription factor [Devosia sp.]